MSRGDARHIRLRSFLPELVVVLVLALALVSFEFDLGRRLGIAPESPADITAPEGLDLPGLPAPEPVAAAVVGGSPSTAAVRAALSPYLGDRKLGRHVVAAVGTVDGSTVYDNGGGLVTPASMTKLLTSAAALASLGPDRRFTTRVVAGNGRRVVLVGGGDPFLLSKPRDGDSYPSYADVRTLARRTAVALRKQGRAAVSLGFDDSLFDGPTFNPAWPADYAADVVPPITALWVDDGDKRDGWGYESDPSQAAAEVFADELRDTGIRVQGRPARMVAPHGATRIAAVQSPTVRQVVDRVLLVSDNEAAEMLAHHVGLAEGFGGSFEGGSRGIRAVLGELGVTLGPREVVYDGSGLSRRNRLTPATLLRVLALGAVESRPELRNLVTGLPVAAFNGSLGYRFDDSRPAGRGRVAAKTGTLTGVSGLAGIATDLDGNPLLFVVAADKVRKADTEDARDALDRLAAALGACHCS